VAPIRLALKSTLTFLAIYVAVVGGVAWWMVMQLRASAESLAQSTAELVGGELARTVAESAIDDLQRGDETTRARLAQIVDDLTEHSSILTSVAVVDRSGKVIAGDNVDVGRQLPIPDAIFGTTYGVRVLSSSGALGGDAFYMVVPLKTGKDLAGYLRLEMRSERIARLYSHATGNLFVVALVGLIAVGGAGVLLHIQLARRSTRLAEALQGAADGESAGSVEERDEFSRALDVARRVGRELIEARGEREQTQQRLGTLLKALDVGVLVLESDMGLEFANDRAAELLGCGAAAELPQRWNDEFRYTVADLRARSSAASTERHVTIEFPPTNGAARLQLDLCELSEHGGFLALVKNADTLAMLQSELGLAMQMRGLTRFYAAFAHDLKAPLNAMVMTLELLKLSLEGDATEKQLKYIGVVNQEIGRLDRQLRTLLTHTAPPSTGPQDVDLRGLLQELEELLAPQARRQRVTLITRLPDDPVIIVGQPDRLKQAMLNILINALEAMPEGGMLDIALERADGSASITVRDNGPGIPPEVLDAIYDMHFTTKSGGTGVGLYVARSVMKSHGGTIDVAAVPEGGTSFTLKLPLPPAASVSL
jgi:signal transduction histidine kinase